MLELLGGTRFSVVRHRGWLNRDVEERLIRAGATPAGNHACSSTSSYNGRPNLCDQAIQQQLEHLARMFPRFPIERLQNWRDQEGRDFDPTSPMPGSLTPH